MIKKWIAVFVVFFLGTSALIAVDQICKERTGFGGQTGLSIHKTIEGDLTFSFWGLEGTIEL